MVTKKQVAFLALGLFIASKSSSQIDYDRVPDVTTKIFINDVHVQKDPTTQLGVSDILIENGLIKEIAPNLKPPLDAKVIEADSAYAYAGFIDAFSHVGIPKDDDKNTRPDVKFKGFPPNDVAGITPEILASSQISFVDPSIKTYREAGFAIVHAVPRGRMLPGQGVIISLSGDSKEKMIIKDKTSTFFQLKGARGFYPNTTIGVMAKWRDLYRNAEFHDKNLKKYALSPFGISRPKDDITLTALIPVTDKRQAVFMTSEKTKDIFRAITLQKDLGYNLVLSDVKQIGSAIKHLKSPDVKLILSLDLPKKSKEKKDSLDLDKKQNALMLRKNKSINEYYSQAANLENNNIDFSFSLMSGKIKDYKTNLLQLIENGLSEKGALSALTTHPAQLLKIDNITGTLEVGKLANINISDKPFFKKNSKLKYVLIDGSITEIKQKPKKKKNNNKSDDINSILGQWSYSTDVMGEEHTGKIEINNLEDIINVELTNDKSPNNILEGRDVTYENGKLQYTITVEPDGQPIPVDVNMEMSEDTFVGTLTIDGIGDFSIEGTKISSPE